MSQQPAQEQSDTTIPRYKFGPGKMGLELIEYNGKLLTDIEIQLLQFYEKREREKKELKERQRQQHLQMSQNFNTITEIDPARIETSRKDKEPPAQVYETQRKLTNDNSMPPAKKLRPSEDSVIQTPAADVVSASSSIPDSQRKGQLSQSLSSSVPLPSHPQPTRASNEMKQTSRFKIPTKELLPSAEIELRDNELDPTSFPANGLILTEDWNPREEHANHGTSKSFLLENFSVLKNQTLVFKVTVPSESKRWSVNLGPPEMHTASSSDENWSNILYHFNPRYAAKRKEFVQCDMTDGMWGVTDRRPFSAYSVLPTGNHMLIIQIRADGIYTSINEMFFSFFKHRRPISEYRELALQLPLTDDPGNPENVIFHKIWWGRRDPKNTSDFIGITSAATEGVDQRNDLSLSVFVGGLPRADTEETLNDLKTLLWELFGDYSPDDVNIIPGKGYGFIRMPSAQLALEAIKAINGNQVDDEDGHTFNLVVSHARSRGI